MAEAIKETLRKNNLRDAYIRPIVTRGGKGDLGLDPPRKCKVPTVIVIAVTWGGAMYGDLYEKGLRALCVSVRRTPPPESMPPNVKSLNYLNNILAKIEANYHGMDEAIFFDTQGHVAEARGDNIFVVKNGELITPPPTLNNLRGVTRLVTLEIAASMGLTVVERNLGYFDLYAADEVFVTGDRGGDRPDPRDRRPGHRERQARSHHPAVDGGLQGRHPEGRHPPDLRVREPGRRAGRPGSSRHNFFIRTRPSCIALRCIDSLL